MEVSTTRLHAAPRDAVDAHGQPKPRLVFFHSRVSGRAERIDGFLANVLQRRQNHDTFKLYRVAVEQQPELARRFRVGSAPTLVVIEDKRLSARLVNPRGTGEIEAFLAPWLKRGRVAPSDDLAA